jgi:hypothetical protein
MSGISKSLSNIGKSVMNSINKAIGAVKKAVQGTSGKDKIGGSTKDLTPNQQEISQKSGTPQNAPQPTVKSGGEQKKKKEEAQQSKTVKKPGGDIFAYSPKYPLFGPPPIMVKGKLVDDVGALKANKILTGVTGATSVDLTVSGGYKNLGGSFQISVSESGITYFGGIGWGLGLGVSLTTGYNIGNSSGLGANFAIAGGKKVGGTVSGTISTGGNSVNAGVGVGVGSGGSITIGYGGTLVSF